MADLDDFLNNLEAAAQDLSSSNSELNSSSQKNQPETNLYVPGDATNKDIKHFMGLESADSSFSEKSGDSSSSDSGSHPESDDELENSNVLKS
jgi:hypothetical protein